MSNRLRRETHSLLLVCVMVSAAVAQNVPVSTITECEHYDDSRGMNLCNDSTRCPGWGSDINQCNNSDWVRYNGINFLGGEFSYLDIYGMDAKVNNGVIEVRIDGVSGTLIASIAGIHNLQSGVWGRYTAPLARTLGVHDVFLVFRSNTGNPADTAIVGSFDRFELRGLTTVNPADARSYYVSTNGDDSNEGSLARPFKTIAKASSIMGPGSTCYIRQGIYREIIRPAGTGLPGAALTYTAFNNEDVIISALEPVTGWSSQSGSIYRAPMDWSIGDYDDQIFLDGEMMWVASCPNVDDVCYKLNLWESHPCNTPNQGKIFPLLIPQQVDFGSSTSITSQLPHTIELHPSSPELPPSMLNKPRDFFKGSLWNSSSLSGIVLDSEPFGNANVAGSEPSLHIAPLRSQWWQQSISGLGRFTHAMNLLDAPREWFRENSTLFLWAPDGGNPSHHLVEAKKRILCADLRGKSYVNLIGLKTIGGSMSLENAFHCTVDKCQSKYVAHMDTMSAAEGGEAFWEMLYDPTTGYKGIYVSGTDNVIKNSLIAISSASGIILDGRDNTVDNCIIRDCDYGSRYDAGIYIDRARTWDDDVACGHRITRNSMRNFGRSAIHFAWTGNTAADPIQIKYNDFGYSMFRCGEGATIYVYGGVGNFTEVAYNWFHDVSETQTAVIYLDDGSRNWIFHHNVFWHGERYNPAAWWHSDFKPNDGTSNLAWNNTHVDSCLKTDFFGTTFCGIELVGYNDLWAKSDTALWQFVDPAHNDYSLRAGSPAIDKGQLIPDITQRYRGAAPDLGAYEFGETPWKAGADWQEQAWVYPPAALASESPHLASPGRSSSAVVRTVPGRLIVGLPGAALAQVRVYNAHGALMSTVRAKGIAEIPTTRWACGVYCVKVTCNGTSAALKAMVR